MSEQSQQWETVSGTSAPFFKFKAVGDSIRGKIIGKRQTPGFDGGKPQDVVDLETTTGEFSIGLTADLRAKLGKVELGKLVEIKLTGSKAIKGKAPMKVYDVKVQK